MVANPERTPNLMYRNNATDAVLFSYNPPAPFDNVTLVDPSTGFRTTGEFDIIVSGTSMTLESTVTIAGIACAVVFRTHTEVRKRGVWTSKRGAGAWGCRVPSDTSFHCSPWTHSWSAWMCVCAELVSLRAGVRCWC